MKRPNITKENPYAVQRDGATYWESVHAGAFEAQQAASALAKKRKKIFSVYKWNEAQKSAFHLSTHNQRGLL